MRAVNKLLGRANDKSREPSRTTDAAASDPGAALGDPGGVSVRATDSTSDPTLRVYPVSAETSEDRLLVHPVYLDTPAIASFFAALDLSLPEQETQRIVEAVVRQRELSAGLKFALPIDALPKIEVGGGRKGSEQNHAELELKSIYRHTAASLFNKLRKTLVAEQLIFRVCLQDHSASQGESRPLAIGQLIELTGPIMRNPLEEAINSYERALPYLGLLAAGRGRRRSRVAARWWWSRKLFRRRTLNDALTKFLDSRRAEPDQVQIMRNDFERAHVRDLLIAVNGSHSLEKAVLTASTELFTDETAAYLVGGTFTVLGKITNVVDRGALDLARRVTIEPSVLLSDLEKGIRRSPGGRQFEKVRASHERAEEGDWSWIIEAPTIQVFPLAIFV